MSEMYASPEFAKSYLAVYGEEPRSKGANAFDIYRLLKFAYGKAGSEKATAAELKSILTQVRDFPGAVGNFSIDADGNSTYRPVLRVIRNGKRSSAVAPPADSLRMLTDPE